MSYRNPKVLQVDPTAFSRGFESSFSIGLEAIQAQQAEQERIRKEADASETDLINATYLGEYGDLDKAMYDQIQTSLRSYIDSGEFANMSKAEQANALNDIKTFKGSFDKLQGIISMSTGDIDARNSELLEFKTAYNRDPKSIKLSGEGLDMSISFNGKTMKLSDLARTRVINKNEVLSRITELDAGFMTSSDKALRDLAGKGKYGLGKDQQLTSYQATLSTGLNKEDVLAIYANQMGRKYDSSKDSADYYESVKQEVVDYKTQEFSNKLNVFDTYEELYKPKVEIKEGAELGINLAKTVAADVPGFFKNIGDFENVSFDNKTGKLSYTYSEEIRDPKTGDKVVVKKTDTKNMLQLGDLRSVALKIFETQIPKEFLTQEQRSNAYRAFEENFVTDFIDYRNRSMKLGGQQQETTDTTIDPATQQEQQVATTGSGSEKAKEVQLDEKYSFGPFNATDNTPEVQGLNKNIVRVLDRLNLPKTQSNVDAVKKEIKSRKGSLSDIEDQLFKEQKKSIDDANKIPGAFVDNKNTVVRFNMQEDQPTTSNLTAIEKRFFEENNIPATFENKEIFKDYVLNNGNISNLNKLDRRAFDKYKN